MRFYQTTPSFYCGFDLHARTMHVCVVPPRSTAGLPEWASGVEDEASLAVRVLDEETFGPITVARSGDRPQRDWSQRVPDQS